MICGGDHRLCITCGGRDEEQQRRMRQTCVNIVER